MHEQAQPPVCRTSNWHICNFAFRQRGSLSIWVDPETLWQAERTGKGGRRPVFSDAAIQTCLTLRVLFGLPLPQTSGLVASLLELAGWTGRCLITARCRGGRSTWRFKSPNARAQVICANLELD